MRVSIAMATYNGGKFLREQLDSFSMQSRLPDELIICDDGSSDDTLDVLHEFQMHAPFAVHIFRNAQNLGYVQNFAKALSLCTGEIIFLSDQDDIWYPNKLAIVTRQFETNPSCLLIANDSDLVDEHLIKSGLTIAGQLRSSGADERQFVNGCGSAIRAEFLNVVLPIPTTIQNGHDGWIHDFGYWLECRKIIPDVLQLYRRHQSNTSQPLAASLSKISWYDEYLKYQGHDPRSGYHNEIEKLILISQRIAQAEECLRSNHLDVSEKLEHIQKFQAALSRRIELSSRSHFTRFGWAINNYIHGDYAFFKGWKSLAKDILRR